MGDPLRSAKQESDDASVPEHLVLAFCADDNYATPLAVAMYSALVNLETDAPVEIHVVGSDFASNHRQRLRSLVDRRGPM